MTGEIDVEMARSALANLPKGVSYGRTLPVKHVYLPQSHLKALDPNALIVSGMRGAGKTFWWSALQQKEVHQLIRESATQSTLGENIKVQTGFGVKPNINKYPDMDILRKMMEVAKPRMIWRTVQVWQLTPSGHPLRKRKSWIDRVRYVDQNPELIGQLLDKRDLEFEKKDIYSMTLFDALDRCADDWNDMYDLIKGLLQTAVEMRAYRRLRIKVFLRSDQIDETKIATFPDASKALSSTVELSWPRHELYGLLWHHLSNAESGKDFRRFLWNGKWEPLKISNDSLFSVPRQLIFKEDKQRERFHDIVGEWMGSGPKRGFPYTWIPNHLGDTEGRVSPRSFLAALRVAADDTQKRHSEHGNALHYDSIKRGVQEASKTRVIEIKEDYPWVHGVLEPLRGMSVPCSFDQIEECWQKNKVRNRLIKDIKHDHVKLPPRHINAGHDGIRTDLESLGIFHRLRDGRVNIPDIFRVGYGLGRKGGVKPVR